jgi:hypothetical protein
LDAVIEGGLRLHFDTHDAPEIAVHALERCDFYFKRSFSQSHVEQLPTAQQRKVVPLGLNYWVLPDAADGFALRRTLALESGVSKLRALKQLPGITHFQTNRASVREIESPPDHDAEPRVLFLATTYDPGNAPSRDKAEERREMNEMRAQYIRVLRKALGSRFVGGLATSEFALRNYADVTITDQTVTAKRNYIKIMKQHPICVATTGLHGSIGWKLAEYVACSRAILSEPIRYAVPGDFSPGQNFMEFRTAEECIANASTLIEDKQLRARLMNNNAAYYRSHLRPDVLIGNALATAMRSAVSSELVHPR